MSSNLRFTGASYFSPNPKLIPIAFACPMCRCPFGSGGNLKRRFFLLKAPARSSLIICSIKFVGFLSKLNLF